MFPEMGVTVDSFSRIKLAVLFLRWRGEISLCAGWTVTQERIPGAAKNVTGGKTVFIRGYVICGVKKLAAL